MITIEDFCVIDAAQAGVVIFTGLAFWGAWETCFDDAEGVVGCVCVVWVGFLGGVVAGLALADAFAWFLQ